MQDNQKIKKLTDKLTPEQKKHFQNKTLPKFQIGWFPNGFILLSIAITPNDMIKYNHIVLTICNVMIIINEKQN